MSWKQANTIVQPKELSYRDWSPSVACVNYLTSCCFPLQCGLHTVSLTLSLCATTVSLSPTALVWEKLEHKKDHSALELLEKQQSEIENSVTTHVPSSSMESDPSSTGAVIPNLMVWRQ